jgi:hypothetical protein
MGGLLEDPNDLLGTLGIGGSCHGSNGRQARVRATFAPELSQK